MVAKMLPSAIPAVLLFQRVSGRDGARTGRTAAFAVGYLLVWFGYSAGATALQWSLHELALLSPMDALVSPRLGGAVLVTAGLYQFLRLKYAILVRCQSPLQFFMLNWREGAKGALTMGLRHGDVMYRVLLVLDAPSVRGGHHEPGLGGGSLSAGSD